jgi:biotin carboxyl carrier protein
VTDTRSRVQRVGNGEYRVETGDRVETVYVAGTLDDLWAFWNGRVYRTSGRALEPRTGSSGVPRRAAATRALAAPMPATVVAVHVAAGASVKKGDTLLVLEAMKMELPLRAPEDATVSEVLCREGDLVAAEAVLVRFS